MEEATPGSDVREERPAAPSASIPVGRQGLAAAGWALIFSGALGAAALGLTLASDSPAILPSDLSRVAIAPVLAVLFFLAEQFVLNVEFRRQAHSLTLAGIPLVMGALLLPSHQFVIARLAGSVIAFVFQRVNLDKVIYNASAYAFEAAALSFLLHLFLGPAEQLDIAVLVTAALAAICIDQFSSVLVLTLIRLDNGLLSRREVRDILTAALVLSVVATAFAAIAILLLTHGLLGVSLLVAAILVLGMFYSTYAVTRRRHQALSLIHTFVSTGVGAESLIPLAEQLLSQIRNLLQASSVRLTITDSEKPLHDKTDDAVLLILGDDEKLISKETKIDRSDWVLVRALAEQEPTLASRTTKDPALRRWLSKRGFVDAIVVPLPDSSGVSGTLTVTNRLGGTATFYEDDLSLLETLTAHFGTALRSVQLIERLASESKNGSPSGNRPPERRLRTSAQLVNEVFVAAQQLGQAGPPRRGGTRPTPWQDLDMDAMDQATDVFIVHGHDERAKHHVARTVQRLLGREPIILDEQPSLGKTVIEKFEAYGARAGFAIVLLTADDEGGPAHGRISPRARQNVVLELGYFFGRLGRGRVVALTAGGVELPSDIAGVVYIDMDQPDWPQRLGREMRQIDQLGVDLNRL